MIGKTDCEAALKLIDAINAVRERVSYGGSSLDSETVRALIVAAAPLLSEVGQAMTDHHPEGRVGRTAREWMMGVSNNTEGASILDINWVLYSRHFHDAARVGLSLYAQGFTGYLDEEPAHG